MKKEIQVKKEFITDHHTPLPLEDGIKKRRSRSRSLGNLPSTTFISPPTVVKQEQQEQQPTTTTDIKILKEGIMPIMREYFNIKTYPSQNSTNTKEIMIAINDMISYVEVLYNNGEITRGLYLYCNKIVECVHKWNDVVTMQQENMSTFVLNSIQYNTALSEQSKELLKKKGGGGGASQSSKHHHHHNNHHNRDPSSVLNTINTDITHIPISNDNKSIKSKVPPINTTGVAPTGRRDRIIDIF